MYTHEYKVRIRYADTDQMGYVYYGKYATFYEIGRVEAMRALGFSYKKLEEEGIMMPVLVNHSQYLQPALYDEVITIKTSIKSIPSVRIQFDYQIYNKAEVLIHEGYTQLVFIRQVSGKPCRVPSKIIELLSPYYK